MSAILEAFDDYFNVELRQNFEAFGLDGAIVEMIDGYYGRGCPVSLETLCLDFAELADRGAVNAAALRLCGGGKLVIAGTEQGHMTVLVPELH